MEGRRRTIELDEEMADALEKRAAAGRDIDRLAAFLERENQAAARRAIGRIGEAAMSLRDFPDRRVARRRVSSAPAV